MSPTIAEGGDFPSAGGVEVEERTNPDGTRTLVRIGRQLGVQIGGLHFDYDPDNSPSWEDVDTYQTSYVEGLEAALRRIHDIVDGKGRIGKLAAEALDL